MLEHGAEGQRGQQGLAVRAAFAGGAMLRLDVQLYDLVLPTVIGPGCRLHLLLRHLAIPLGLDRRLRT